MLIFSAAEFKAQYCGLNPKANGQKLPSAEIPDVAIPKSFDWRKKKVVTDVKDQVQILLFVCCFLHNMICLFKIYYNRKLSCLNCTFQG